MQLYKVFITLKPNIKLTTMQNLRSPIVTLPHTFKLSIGFFMGAALGASFSFRFSPPVSFPIAIGLSLDVSSGTCLDGPAFGFDFALAVGLPRV